MVYADMPSVYERIENYLTNVGQSDVTVLVTVFPQKKIKYLFPEMDIKVAKVHKKQIL